MKLFLIERKGRTSYDEYDSAVVVAICSEDAKFMDPGLSNCAGWTNGWVSPKDVSVTYLGEAREGIPIGFVCKSFNAG